MLTLALATCSLLTTGLRVERTRLVVMQQPWRSEEDWVLADEVGKWTVGDGDGAVTFWRELAKHYPELRGRSADECRARVNGAPQPPVLDSWQILDDGRFCGELPPDGRELRVRASLEGRLPVGVRWIETEHGKLYQLGVPKAEPPIPSALQAALDLVKPLAKLAVGGQLLAVVPLASLLFVTGLPTMPELGPFGQPVAQGLQQRQTEEMRARLVGYEEGRAAGGREEMKEQEGRYGTDVATSATTFASSDVQTSVGTQRLLCPALLCCPCL